MKGQRRVKVRGWTVCHVTEETPCISQEDLPCPCQFQCQQSCILRGQGEGSGTSTSLGKAGNSGQYSPMHLQTPLLSSLPQPLTNMVSSVSLWTCLLWASHVYKSQGVVVWDWTALHSSIFRFQWHCSVYYAAQIVHILLTKLGTTWTFFPIMKLS